MQYIIDQAGGKGTRMRHLTENKPKALTRSCPLCNATRGEILKSVKMISINRLPIPSEYDVVVCEKCGFCFADADAIQENYNTYYRDYNVYGNSGILKQEELGKECTFRFPIFEKFVSKDAEIIDIGCGDGNFLLYLKKRGYKNLYGIDPSTESIRILKEKGIAGSVGNIFDEISKEFEEKRFDVVVCTEVLEHIYALKDAMVHLDKYLKSDGMLYIDVPSVEYFEKELLPVANYFNCEHINYFNLQTLDNLLHIFGYERISEERKQSLFNESENCVRAMYRKTPEAADIICDMKSRVSIRSYLSKIAEKTENRVAMIQKLLDENERLIIWGTGNYTYQLLAEFPEKSKKVVCFIDNNELKWGNELVGKQVKSPQCLLNMNEHYPILICSMINAGDIVEQLKEMDVCNPHYVLD